MSTYSDHGKKKSWKEASKDLSTVNVGYPVGKVPPQAVDMEEAVIGALLTYSKVITQVVSFLREEMFYKASNRLIYHAIVQLYEDNKPVDELSVMDRLKRNNALQDVGGPYYIAKLSGSIASATNIQYWARIIVEKFLLREIIRISSAMTQLSYEEGTDIFDLIERYRNEMEKLDVKEMEEISVSMKEAIGITFDEILQRKANKIITFYKTGIEEFDKQVTFARRECIILGGAAGHGKTRFTISLMKLMLGRYKDIAVDWFSLEDSKEKIVRLMIGSDLKISDQEIQSRDSELSQEKIDLLQASKEKFMDYDVNFVEESTSVKSIRYHFKRFCEERPQKFCILVVDNIMHIAESRQDRDDYIMSEFNSARKENKNGMIFLLHHYNDEQMGSDRIKSAYRPRIKDLKGREAYRRSATQVLLMNAPGNYPDLVSEYKGWEDVFKYLCLIEVAKNRDVDDKDANVNIIRFWTDLTFIKYQIIK